MAQVNLDTASRLDIICRKGDSFQIGVDFGIEMPDPDAAGVTYRMEVRDSDTSSTIRLAASDFTFTRGDGASVTNAKITIEAPDSAMDFSGLFVYDFQIEDSGTQIGSENKVKTYLYGTFKAVEDITESA
jgi:hypothetical protein